jgi:hypothetical protein
MDAEEPAQAGMEGREVPRAAVSSFRSRGPDAEQGIGWACDAGSDDELEASRVDVELQVAVRASMHVA